MWRGGLDELQRYLKGTDVVIRVALRTGGADATVWGCDLTEGYIDINGKYST